MPVKRRDSKHREHRITPAAVAASNAGDECALHDALDLAPWHPSPLAVDDGPGPEGLHAFAEFWPFVQSLSGELIAAGALESEDAEPCP
jgi:hypothetical protein